MVEEGDHLEVLVLVLVEGQAVVAFVDEPLNRLHVSHGRRVRTLHQFVLVHSSRLGSGIVFGCDRKLEVIFCHAEEKKSGPGMQHDADLVSVGQAAELSLRFGELDDFNQPVCDATGDGKEGFLGEGHRGVFVGLGLRADVTASDGGGVGGAGSGAAAPGAAVSEPLVQDARQNAARERFPRGSRRVVAEGRGGQAPRGGALLTAVLPALPAQDGLEDGVAAVIERRARAAAVGGEHVSLGEPAKATLIRAG